MGKRTALCLLTVRRLKTHRLSVDLNCQLGSQFSVWLLNHASPSQKGEMGLEVWVGQLPHACTFGQTCRAAMGAIRIAVVILLRKKRLRELEWAAPDHTSGAQIYSKDAEVPQPALSVPGHLGGTSNVFDSKSLSNGASCSISGPQFLMCWVHKVGPTKNCRCFQNLLSQQLCLTVGSPRVPLLLMNSISAPLQAVP